MFEKERKIKEKFIHHPILIMIFNNKNFEKSTFNDESIVTYI